MFDNFVVGVLVFIATFAILYAFLESEARTWGYVAQGVVTVIIIGAAAGLMLVLLGTGNADFTTEGAFEGERRAPATPGEYASVYGNILLNRAPAGAVIGIIAGLASFIHIRNLASKQRQG